MSSESYERKRNFIRCELSRLARAMFPAEIACLEYHLHDDGDSRDEILIIRHMSGYTRRLNITGMDLPGTSRALLDELEGCA